MRTKQYYMLDVIILGSGPSGCAAALYSIRAGLKTLVIEGPVFGGQLMTTTDVVNYPGFINIQGPDLMFKMRKQCESHGVQFVSDWIKKCDFTKGNFKLIGKETYRAKSVIICTGSQAKYLGLKSEQKYLGYGVSACATCDGAFYKNKHVVVVGGGNVAVEEALYLSKICSQVTLIHRRNKLRAEYTLQKKLFNTKNIIIEWDANMIEVLGEEGYVVGCLIKNVLTDAVKKVHAEGIFIAIGHTPQTSLFKDHLKLDQAGYLMTNDTETNIPGVFAAGDVQDPIYKQAIVAAGDGCKAALKAIAFLSA